MGESPYINGKLNPNGGANPENTKKTKEKP